jgi:hypothetical protein
MDKIDWITAYREWPKEHSAEWQRTDDVLYELCQSKYPDHSDLGAIEAKLLFIGRGFGTNVEKQIKDDTELGKLSILASHLRDHSGAIAEIINSLKQTAEPLDGMKLSNVLKLHSNLCEMLKPVTRNGTAQLTSFVSKYLHFHAPIVPIYDKFAKEGAHQMVLDLSEAPSKLGVKECDKLYKSYCENFLAIYQELLSWYARSEVTVRLAESFIFKTEKKRQAATAKKKKSQRS